MHVATGDARPGVEAVGQAATQNEERAGVVVRRPLLDSCYITTPVTPEAQLVFAIIGVATVLFVSGKVRLDITALLVVLALMLSGVLTVKEAVSGFGDPIILILAGLFVMGEALIQTGVAYRVGDWLADLGGGSEARLIALLMLATAGLGSVMSSTGVVAIFIPIVLRIASATGRSPSRLLMPVSYGALISGMLTLIATPPNLVVNDVLQDAGAETFSLFSFAPVGLGVLVAAIGYMLLVGRRILGEPAPSSHDEQASISMRELGERYGVLDAIHAVVVEEGSPLIDRSPAELGISDEWHAYVLACERKERFLTATVPVTRDTRFKAGDLLLVKVAPSELPRFAEDNGLTEVSLSGAVGTRAQESFGAAEILIPPESKYVGESVHEIQLRTRFGLTALGLRRKGKNVEEKPMSEPFKPGDTILVAGGWKQIKVLESDPRNLILLAVPKEIKQAVPMSSHAPVAFLILAAMVVFLVLEPIPMLATILIAALALVATGCLTMERAYESTSWSTLVLVAGLLPLALALEKTGGMELVANGLMSSIGGLGPYGILTVVFFVTACLSMFLSNTATAVLIAPLAIRLASELGVQPQALAVMVIMGASTSFVTPVSSPVVALVMSPGNYRFTDFVKVGTPLVLITWIVSLAITPLLFPM